MRSKGSTSSLTKEHLTHWEEMFKYKSFGSTDLLGNALNSFFTDKPGMTVFIALWEYLESHDIKPETCDINWKMKFKFNGFQAVCQMKEKSKDDGKGKYFFSI
jgi:hypothetical protein